MSNYYQKISQRLHTLGFNEYEAMAYIVLLQKGPLTGYQLAKESGVPRPNIYSVLGRLEGRGAVSRINTKGGDQYSALPAKDLIRRLRGEFDSNVDQFEQVLRGLPPHGEPERAWNIEGRDAVLQQTAKTIETAERRLHIGITPADAKSLTNQLQKAEERGVDITTLCFAGCERECGGCRGKIYRYPVGPGDGQNWLMAAADDRTLVLAQTGADGTRAIHSRLGVLIALAVQYLQNGIAVAEIVRSLGDQLPGMVDEKAAQALRSAGLGNGGVSWLDRLLGIVNRQRNFKSE